jgi:hypothetical protein
MTSKNVVFVAFCMGSEVIRETVGAVQNLSAHLTSERS